MSELIAIDFAVFFFFLSIPVLLTLSVYIDDARQLSSVIFILLYIVDTATLEC